MAITKIEVPELFDFGSDNSAFKLPTGTTAERPTSPSNGEMRFNTTTGYVEYYDTTDAQWWEIDYAPILPSDNFNTVLYTGDGTTSQGKTGVGFQPNFTWIKNRSSSSNNHALFDSVRGIQRELRSDTAGAENDYTATNYSLKSFDIDGFTVGDVTAGNYNVNGAVGGTYSGNAEFVAWNWKAGGAAVSNTDGTITSQVSANVEAGFSIASYTGNGIAGSTVGHGLDSTPEMVIVKSLTTTANGSWSVYHIATGPTKSITLELPNTPYTDVGYWNNTSPTSIVFTLGYYAVSNQSSANYIAYAFHSVAGYSKIGSYTGNGSTTGPTIVTGFEPAFVMIKRTDSTGVWVMLDNKRNITNPRNSSLYANTSAQEDTGSTSGFYPVNFYSNGFEPIQNTGDYNASGGSYIFMAFAADPT